MSTITQTIMNAQAGPGVSTAVNVENYKTVNLTVSGAATPTGTLKFAVSDSELAPNFALAASPTNPWVYAAVVDVQSGSVIAGNTGVSFAGTAATNMYSVNVDGMRWVSAEVTAYTLGNYTVLMRAHPVFTPIA